MATQTLRRETNGLVRLADRDLSKLWRVIAQGASAEVALRDTLPAIVTTYGEAGSALAADYYDAEREKAHVRRRFSAIPLAAEDRGAQALIGAALSSAVNDTTLRAIIAGGVQRRIADHVRLTVANSSVADPSAFGWVRVGEGNCKSGWCDQYLDGEIRTVEGYDFPAHDNCQCSVVPAF